MPRARCANGRAHEGSHAGDEGFPSLAAAAGSKATRQQVNEAPEHAADMTTAVVAGSDATARAASHRDYHGVPPANTGGVSRKRADRI